MKFCDSCNSKLINTLKVEKCPKCDKEELESIIELTENEKKEIKSIIELNKNEKKAIIYSLENFPYEKEQYYLQKDVRKTLGLGPMSGINYNKNGNFIVLFMSAHDLSSQKNNHPYTDIFDSQTGLYHYTGRGTKGDQTLTGANEHLASSSNNSTDVHLFKQQESKNKHQYVGLVKLEKIIPSTQLDGHGKNRKVYQFLLKQLE